MNASFPRFDQAATYKQISPLLRVSFEFIDWETDLFFLHGFDAEFYVRLFTCLQTIQTCTVEQMAKKQLPSLGCKAIFKTDTGSRSGFPERIVARIAMMLSKGPRDVMQVKAGSHEQLLRLKGENDALVAENNRLAREFEELMSVWAEK
jgi:hypothetical protein